MTDLISARLDLARRIAAEAGQRALSFFRNREALVIETKASPQDIVSRADREVEDMIRARIGASFPQDAILGEEAGASAGSSGFTWVIDPIDGTSPFLAGLPHWCVAIAVVHEAETVAGVIDVPMAGEQFHSLRGGGAWVNETRLSVRADATVRNSMVAIGASHRTDPAHITGIIQRLMAAGGIFYRNGSGALMLASVAAGRLGGYYEPHMHPWDCLAALLMIEEAGGRALPLPGPLADGGKILGTAPGLWEELRELTGGGAG
ncbi:inositol monophosphatase family protein [Halodurantibacterium flavum]|uniref:Inositol monophosphatase family protein n=1 Tax=Halodurantibacterium flavum TaxID=1382802 RepID=A0ABW4SA13_9RHOB